MAEQAAEAVHDTSDPDTSDARYAAASGALATKFGDGLAILDVATNTYFSIDTVGALVWESLDEPRTLDALVDRVTEEFDVDPARCRDDLVALLADLKANNLVVAA